MTQRYVTIAEDAPGYFELEIKRSRFLGVARSAADEVAAREVIEAERKQYPDAHHHCSAFTYLPAGWENGVQPVQHSSDDGEPSGTAGRPLLDVLLGSGLCGGDTIFWRDKAGNGRFGASLQRGGAGGHRGCGKGGSQVRSRGVLRCRREPGGCPGILAALAKLQAIECNLVKPGHV